jgi:hypothetical protein
LAVDGAWRDERMFDRASADAVMGWLRWGASKFLGGRGCRREEGFSEGACRRVWRLAVGDNQGGIKRCWVGRRMGSCGEDSGNLTTLPTRVYNMTWKKYKPQTNSSCFQGRRLIVVASDTQHVGQDRHRTGGDVRSRIRVCGMGKMRRLFQQHINNISKQ